MQWHCADPYRPGENDAMQSKLRRDEGMTLIEVLVVIMILGIFMAIAVPGIIKSFKAMDQAKRLTARYPNAHKALNQMSNMLRHTYPTALSPTSAFIGRNLSIEAGGIKLPCDELNFPVLDTTYAHVRSAQRITFKLESNPAEQNSPSGLVQTRLFLDTASTTAVKETVLERVVGLEFSYLDGSTDPPQWVNEWPPASPDEEGAPLEPKESAETTQEAVSDIPVAATQEDSIRVPDAVKITIYVPGEVSPKPKSFTTVINIPAR